MFIKVTRSGPRRYVQLVEAYRDDAGHPRQRTVATLGRLDQLGSELESVISGLMRVTGKSLPEAPPAPLVSFEPARDFGDVWTLTELWNSLGFDRLRKVFRPTRHTIDVEALIRVMVLNRLCDPESKLGVLRWLETVTLPGIMAESIDHQHLLRAMDALVDHKEEVDEVMASLLRPLVDQDLAVVFYDMTTIRAAGLSEQEADVRHYGMSKEGVVARQVMLGVVQTAEGLPLYHEVFDGNTAEVTTLKGVIEKIVKRFPVKRVIAVADRGLLSTDNLADLQGTPCLGAGCWSSSWLCLDAVMATSLNYWSRSIRRSASAPKMRCWARQPGTNCASSSRTIHRSLLKPAPSVMAAFRNCRNRQPCGLASSTIKTREGASVVASSLMAAPVRASTMRLSLIHI